ncbi:FAD-binding oxidoreductase [Allobranchiibius sp. CTAmp26]|uniref:NAD(P)/FAD-dependent oxidoreductase n=1 Tax=Allobranchiibius sp. CTAmp26 TaxID=2815214 RepID=UPI001AA0E6E9|nr:FAD-dependent oxidoreductase [Allobranchiibius sp. CTAmp26]MBO1754092.1 FAD-dependent oxidoreductase [Allobranchiibius sp. CTAmp26]
MDVSATWRDASTTPYWLDTPDRPAARSALTADTHTDLLVVGGGFSGLWTALLAKERDPDRDVLLVEGDRIGWAASGRNGGFCSASLTHGRDNGAQRFPDEIETLERLGRENLAAIGETVQRYGIDCDYHLRDSLTVATEPYQVREMRDAATGFLDQDAVRARLDSPTFLGGYVEEGDLALVDPARLAWGLADAAERLGVRIAEHTRVSDLAKDGDRMRLRTDGGRTITAAHVALGTNAFPSLVKRVRLHTVPVYDYVLMTEPLSDAQLASIGWAGREGVDDAGNQFHYYRMTADRRILWGGYDAIYHFGRAVRPAYDQRTDTFEILARQFFATFPQLEGLRFSHRWGGAIDTCTRFFAFFGTAYDARVSYALGYTGLGVGATRFGARVMLDLLSGAHTELTELAMVRTKPLPFPPEPLAYAGIQATRVALAAADRHEGKRNLWLRGLDKVGLGFDS